MVGPSVRNDRVLKGSGKLRVRTVIKVERVKGLPSFLFVRESIYNVRIFVL